MVEIRARHAEYSALRERIVEHIFIGEAMRRLWQLGVLNVEILHAEFDSSGYDLVMCCGRVMRHVQFKVSLVNGARAQVTINQRLAQAPSGCVVWLGVSEALEIMEYRWFGGEPGRPLPDLSDRALGCHTRGNAQGIKGERSNQRILTKGAFEVLGGLDETLGRLFAITRSEQEGK